MPKTDLLFSPHLTFLDPFRKHHHAVYHSDTKPWQHLCIDLSLALYTGCIEVLPILSAHYF